tara:strand:+ start:1227 stop:2291 length:1065 start_codon:yes stop_codon:yes gene_type:complete
MKIVTILGARPQFIKASSVSRQFLKFPKIIEVILHTGQHFDQNMSQVFFDQMGLSAPKYNLGIQSLSHGAMTGRQLEEIEKVLIKEIPDYVMVYGDTNSTLSGALASAKLNIPVIHIEAGLRSYNKSMPEEINRVLTDHVSELLFTPTKSGFNNLINEGVSKDKIHNFGDVMYDSAIFFSNQTSNKNSIIEKLKLRPLGYILATFHRQSNTDDSEKLKNIIRALSGSKLPVVLPLHPRTEAILNKNKIVLNNPIIPIDPVGYMEMINLEKNSYKIITDSGGVQKEAYFFGKNCIIVREETEWIELKKSNAHHLVGNDFNKITDLVNSPNINYKVEEIFGDGNASKKIVNKIAML